MGKMSIKSLLTEVVLSLPFLLIDGPTFAEEQKGTRSQTASSASTLLYYSDYFSFIGADESGRVSFALDNNRGQDGDSWQAEHFVVLHAEKQGWVKIAGNGAFPNAKHDLEKIPDSESFQFDGKPSEGIVIRSAKNELTLTLDPMPIRLTRKHKAGQFLMGSAPGVLEWKGRVIYEYLHMPTFNRLTRSYPGMRKDFHGLYAWVEGEGDLYIHQQQGELFKPVVGELVGFAFLNENDIALEDLQIEVPETKQAKGTYHWPVHWRGGWKTGESRATFDLHLSELDVIGNWGTGGFSMGIITGALHHREQKLSLYGLGELLISAETKTWR